MFKLIMESINRAPAIPRPYRLDEVLEAAGAIDRAIPPDIEELTANATTALDDIERTCRENAINDDVNPAITQLQLVFHRAKLRDTQVIQY